MEKAKECVLNELRKMGIPEEHLADMNITTTELGLSSMDCVSISVAAFDQFGVRIKLVKEDNKSLNDICEDIAKAVENK